MVLLARRRKLPFRLAVALNPPRRIYVEFTHEREVWQRQGKYVLLDGRTCAVASVALAGREPIEVDLVEAPVPDGVKAMDIEHWRKRDV